MKMEIIDVNNFSEIKECVYKEEVYSVRDNGAVMRHKREGKQLRKDDDVWTFGIKNKQNGYMLLGSHRIHIIVATAFYGAKDSKVYVVGHIDTNRCNNRAENLRWLTRLENVLLNPVTLKRVTYLCGGDIMNFIKDPSCLRDTTGTNIDLEWMRTVTAEEAKTAYDNIMIWTARPNKTTTTIRDNKVQDWMFVKKQTSYQIHDITAHFIKALFPENALQKDWRTPTEFPCCPQTAGNEPINCYAKMLSKGKIFSSNQYAKHEIISSVIVDSGTSILVMTHDITQNPIKPFAIAKIYFAGGQYIHESIQTFFSEDGVKKQFTLLQGMEWMGPDSIDDYC